MTKLAVVRSPVAFGLTLAASFACCAASFACSSTSTNFSNAGTGGGAGGSQQDAQFDSSILDAQDAGEVLANESGVTTLLHEPFETQISCSDWQSFGGTATPTTDNPYQGLRSCQLCVGNVGMSHITKAVSISQPGNYAVSVYLRSDADAAKVPWEIHLILNASDTAWYGPSTGSVGTGWTKVGASANAPSPPESLAIDIYDNGAAGECLYIDEVIALFEQTG